MRVCQVHGGVTPSGIASPHYRTGRYSKSLPVRLAAQYEAARTDPRLLELRDEIALTDARLAALLGRLDTGETADAWGEARACYIGLRGSMQRQDKGAIGEALADLDRLITRGGDEAMAWSEISATLEQRRRLVESERKRLVEAQQMISTERAMVLLGAIVSIIREHVTDRGTLSAISQGIERLITIEPEPS